MQRYDGIEAYLLSLRSDPLQAVISLKMATDALGISRAAVERQLESGSLDGAWIGKTKCVFASSVYARQEDHSKKLEKVRKALEKLASKGETTVYTPIMDLVGMKTKVPKDRAAIGALLGEISRESDEAHEFMLSALVFNRNAGKPSPSFFQLARNLEYDVSDEDRFLQRQLKKIWKHYRTT